MTALAITWGGRDGVKNLCNQDEGNFAPEKRGVIVCPATTSDVLISGVMYLGGDFNEII